MMIKKIAATLVSLALLGSLPLVSSYAQEEEGAENSIPALVILVVNRQQVFLQSAAGQDMRAKLKIVNEEIAAAEKAETDALIVEAQSLVQQKAILPSSEFKDKQLKLAQTEEFIKYKFNQEKSATRDEAQQQIVAKLLPILQNLMEEKSGTLLIDQSNLVMASMDYDVTADTIARMNQALPTVEVKRVLFEELVEKSKAAIEKQKSESESEGEAATE